MKPDRQQLLNELLGGEPGARREATLLAGARLLRRRRHWRAATRVAAFGLILLAAGLWWHTVPAPRPSTPTPWVVVPPPAPAGPKELTDAELLALFPDTPVGLATLSDGRKRLIFPRPGDEEKYVVHL
jgi:hypothetical protein